MGSGSTGKAAALEGFSFVGIEGEGEYAEITRTRIAFVRQSPPSVFAPEPAVTLPSNDQLEMFT